MTCTRCGRFLVPPVAGIDPATYLCPPCASAAAQSAALVPPSSADSASPQPPLPTSAVQDPASSSGWASLLPRSPAPWAFILVLCAFDFAVESLASALINPLFPHTTTPYAARGWPTTILHFTTAVVFVPLFWTLLLAAIIELCRLARLPALICAAIATLALAVADGIHWWPHGLVILPSFALLSFSYLYWRPVSWKHAYWIAVLIFTLYNATLYTHLVMNQIHRNVISAQLTGNPFAWDASSTLFDQSFVARKAGDQKLEFTRLSQAINLYPYNSNYYVSFGLILRDRHDFTGAETAMRKAVSIDSYSWMAWDDLSFVLYDEKRYSEAMDDAQRAYALAYSNDRPDVQKWIDYIHPKLTGTSQ